jgi:cyclopropane-fatty-acyl-phospholipid synthase
MGTQQAPVGDRAVKKTLSFVEKIFGPYHPRDFAVRLWDGTTWDPEQDQPARFTLVLHHPESLRKMFWPPGELALAEAYIHDDFDIEGDIESVFELGDYFEERSGNFRNIQMLADLFRLPPSPIHQANRTAAFLKGSPHSKKRDRQAVNRH